MPGDLRIIDGIEYASVLGYRPLLLDLYLPPAGLSPAGSGSSGSGSSGSDPAAPRPAVVLFLHGGGWGLGTRKDVGPAFGSWRPSFFERLALAGFAVASADYRLSGEARFPAQLHDAKAAVRWLRRHAGHYGLDSDRIVAWGASAGGHLAALVGLTGDVAELEGTVGEGSRGPGGPGPGGPGPGGPGPGGPGPGGPAERPTESSRVAAVVDWYGPTDLLSMEAQSGGTGPMSHDAPDGPEGKLIGGRVSELPELARAASPISYVLPGPPPFLIMHGTADRAVPLAQSETLAEALAAAGAQVETEWIEGSDHMWIGAPDIEGIFTASVDFARRVTSAKEGSASHG
jgi:acetyl esterase/lipase